LVTFTLRGTDYDNLRNFFDKTKDKFFAGTDSITANMRARGGGIIDLELINKSDLEPNYFQLKATFETKDAMGANFINSVLEGLSQILQDELAADTSLSESEKEVNVLMCILSNYTPECLVRAEVNCPVESLVEGTDISPEDFAKKFEQAVHVARIEPYRATTHNKGIMNGIDAVVLATGNDFRAVEACAHTYASRNGQYSSLTDVKIEDGIFTFWIEVPLSLGTVGGITSLHPMVKFAHDLLGNPSAPHLMEIAATVGLAQNFGALRSLVTTGIQQGHMKMHLMNILNTLEATDYEKGIIKKQFETEVVSFQAVTKAFCEIRGIKNPSEVHEK